MFWANSYDAFSIRGRSICLYENRVAAPPPLLEIPQQLAQTRRFVTQIDLPRSRARVIAFGKENGFSPPPPLLSFPAR